MHTPTIPQFQKSSEHIIRHSLDNSISAIDQLNQTLNEKGFKFVRNKTISNYKFDFYCPQSKIAIEIDSYAHEFSDIHNLDAPKKFSIASLGITVLKFTDYQILTDIEEIIRTIKNQANSRVLLKS